MDNRKYKIYSLGCKISQYDASRLGEFLKLTGFRPVNKVADVVVISTCSVTRSAILKNKWAINKARRENPGAKIILLGCWPRAYKAEALRAGVDLIWSEKDLAGLVQKISTQPLSVTGIIFNKTADRSRYFLKVQDGCEQFCAYCIIPYARGKLSSRPLKEVLKEAQAAVQNGFQEIVLSGVHLGLYGINNINKKIEEPGVDLIRLLKELALIPKIKKIRLSSLEIREADERLLELMLKEKKLCQHLHLPLQSGCDKILSTMRRPYDTDFFRKRIALFRATFPDIAISTDVIVGFPGETAKDFLKTERFIKEMAFSRLHVFSFSAHEKTLAYAMEPKVSVNEIKKRSLALRQIDSVLRKEFLKKFSGRILEAVVEARRDNFLKLKTEYYFDVWVDEKTVILPSGLQNSDLIGKVVDFRLD